MTIGLAISGWMTAALFYGCWRHAERWSERHFQMWWKLYQQHGEEE